MRWLVLRQRLAGSTLLRHAIKVMQRPRTATQRLGVRNGGGDIRFREQHCLRQSAAVGQMTGEGCSEGTSCAVSRGRALAFGLVDLMLNPTPGGEAEQIDSFL